MNFDTLKYKKKIDVDGESKVDLVEPSITINEEINLLAIAEVREDEVGRPDLIALRYYGDSTKSDIIMKANGFTNPFAFYEGQEIRIPDLAAAEKYISRTPARKNTADRIRENFKRTSEQDPKRKEFLKKKATSTNPSSENLPPNILKSDEVVKIVENGKIVLGANIPRKTE